MILSVSRRTDIPACYADWFMNRVRDGFVYVRNPMYAEKVSKVAITKDVIDCIVFWTKNPCPLIPYQNELDGYNYYFQFTLTGYGKDVEPALGTEKEQIQQTFLELSDMVGKNRVIWRYDPIFLSETYSMEFHINTFTKLANSLRGYTERVVISFIDLYGSTVYNTKELSLRAPSEEEMHLIARSMAKIAEDNGMQIEACAEKTDLTGDGVRAGHCIDKEYIENLIGYRLTGTKDKSQREACGCMESVDIGKYDTCPNGCKYCYANNTKSAIQANIQNYTPDSKFLCDIEKSSDMVAERDMRSLKRKNNP